MPQQNSLILSQIITKLLEINTPKLLSMVRNLNSKYEYASLSQHLMHFILAQLDLPQVQKACAATGKDDKAHVDLGSLLESV